MFTKQNVYAMQTGFLVRAKDKRENDKNLITEVRLEIPLDHDLADEILPQLARDLYVQTGDGYQPKDELSFAGFDISPGVQTMTVRQAAELNPVARINGVNIRNIKARKDNGVWFLVFLAGWTMNDPEVAVEMLKLLKQGVYLTLELEQPTLKEVEAEDQPAEEAKPRARRGRRQQPAEDTTDERQDSMAGLST